LTVFLAQNGNHVERRTASQSRGDQFDGLWSRAAGGIVQQEVVAASGLAYKLAPLAKWLCEFDFGRDHDCLLQCLLCYLQE
jgi:hypothetical protein